jgi:hypothetical protein
MMPTIYGLTQVVEILQSASGSRRWHNVLELLRQEMDADGVALSEYHFMSKQGKIGTHVGYDPKYIRLYEERGSKGMRWDSE